MNQEILKEEQSVPKITDLIDISILQQIQDWASKTAGVSILIRDANGYPINARKSKQRFLRLFQAKNT